MAVCRQILVWQLLVGVAIAASAAHDVRRTGQRTGA